MLFTPKSLIVWLFHNTQEFILIDILGNQVMYHILVNVFHFITQNSSVVKAIMISFLRLQKTKVKFPKKQDWGVIFLSDSNHRVTMPVPHSLIIWDRWLNLSLHHTLSYDAKKNVMIWLNYGVWMYHSYYVIKSYPSLSA